MFYQGPITYQGNKRRLMPQIAPLLAPTKTFVDMFAGSGTVGLNAPAEDVLFNDKSEVVMELLCWLAGQSYYELEADLDETIASYGLSNRTRGVIPPIKIQDYNRPGYLLLRKDYNDNPSPKLLFLLIAFSFNNQIRFNKAGKFNLPVGVQDFNNNVRSKLKDYIDVVNTKRIFFSTDDFRVFHNLTKPDTLFYADPPYLNTTATYNENGGWTIEDERDLYFLLDTINARGQKFALSNVVTTKGVVNEILVDWMLSTDYTIHHLKMDYTSANYQRKNPQLSTDEVLITNY